MLEPAPRILFALANGGRGGMQSQVQIVVAALAARGLPVGVAVGPGEFRAPEGVAVFELPAFSSRWPVPTLAALRRVRRAFGADIVHGHGLRLAPLVARSSAQARLVTCHGIDPGRAARTLARVRSSRVQFVACGEGPRSLMAAHGVDAVVLDNAVAPPSGATTPGALRELLGLDAQAPIVVLPARFSEQKGHATLLSALRAVRSRLRSGAPEVVCVGDGPLFEEIRREAQLDGDRPLMRCLPFTVEAGSWLGASDFFVLPSRWEGQPQVVIEALIRGLSVLTCTSTGVEDLIVNGRNGQIVNGPAGLADAIVRWCEEPASRPRDEALSAAIVAQHRIDVVVESYLALYGSLLDTETR